MSDIKYQISKNILGYILKYGDGNENNFSAVFIQVGL